MKLGKVIFKIVQVLVILISVSYVFYKLYNEYQSGVFAADLLNFNLIDAPIFTFALLLVFVNWYLESIKFKCLVQSMQEINIATALQGVLAGIAVSIFTPKRFGEFGGRIFVLKTENRVNGIFATLLGNLSQLLITLAVGSLLFPIYWSKNSLINIVVTTYPFFIPLALVLLVLLLIMYLYVSKLVALLKHTKAFKKHEDFLLFLQNYKKIELLKFLGLSFLRYMVFTFQFILLLKLFKVDLSFFNAIVGISQVYFFMTLLPTLSLGELGVRGSVSVWVLSIFTSAASGIVAASVLLWIINLALPALGGSYYLSKLKY